MSSSHALEPGSEEDANHRSVARVNRGSQGDPPTVLAVITHASLQETVLSAAARWGSGIVR